MTIDELWIALEKDASNSGCAWLTRFATPASGQPLYVGLEKATMGRALLLAVPEDAIPARRNWPECHGLEVLALELNKQSFFGVRLRDANFSDVFTALASDMAPRVNASPNINAAVATLLNRLARWQQFLSATRQGLSPERQRALWGELNFLRSWLLPVFGCSDSVASWRAPSASHQDFQFSAGSIEIKTTSAKQPQSVRISSERQLDCVSGRFLYLHVLIIDERTVADDKPSLNAVSLPQEIELVRDRLQQDAGVLQQFENALLETGYLDLHRSRYERTRYALRKELTFYVTDKFPKITERSLPDGIGEVQYSLSLSACSAFAAKTEAVLQNLFQPPCLNRKSKK